MMGLALLLYQGSWLVANVYAAVDKTLDFLAYHIHSADDHAVRWKWEVGSVAMWDNRYPSPPFSSIFFIEECEVFARVNRINYPYLDAPSTASSQAHMKAKEGESGRRSLARSVSPPLPLPLPINSNHPDLQDGRGDVGANAGP
jgi:hypothetical protein